MPGGVISIDPSHEKGPVCLENSEKSHVARVKGSVWGV